MAMPMYSLYALHLDVTDAAGQLLIGRALRTGASNAITHSGAVRLLPLTMDDCH